MGMEDAEKKMMKKMIDVARQKPLNFGICLANNPEDTSLYMDLQKSPEILARRAKSAAGGSKVACGTIRASGKELHMTLLEAAPGGLALKAREFLRANDIMMTVTIIEGSGAANMDAGKTGDPKVWAMVEKNLLRWVDGGLSRLKDASRLRAQWAQALQKAIDEDFEGAGEIADVIEAEIRKQSKSYAKDLLALGIKNFDAKKAAMTDDQRKAIRKLFGDFTDIAETGTPDELHFSMQRVIDATNKAIKQLKTDKEDSATSLKSELARLETEMKLERDKLKDPKTDGQKRSLSEMETRLKEISRKHPGDESRIAKLISAIERVRDEIREKERFAEEQNVAINEQLAALQKVKAAAEDKQKLYIKALDMKLQSIRKQKPSFDITSAQALINSKIEEMAKAAKWQEDEIARAAADDSHGTGRHGAQTGVHQQARRAATGDLTPDDPVTNPSGTTRMSTKWDKVTIEWDEHANGARTIANGGLIEKTVTDNITHLSTRYASSWHSPVMEKQAVDMAIKKMDDKGWNEINDGGWKALDKVELVVGPPPGDMKSWGYSLKRTGPALAAATAKDAVREFEKGDITIDELLRQLNVEYLTEASGALEPIPYAVVRLMRGSGTDAWKSKTHFPNASKKAAGWDIEGKQVRKTGKAIETASF